MNEQWKTVIVTRIGLATYVTPNSGKHLHKERPLHGLVLNDGEGIKDYCFADGHVVHTEEHSLFYLPKGSSYSVKTIRRGGCCAINFDAELSDKPFSVHLRNSEQLWRQFKTAADAWKRGDAFRSAIAMRAVYDGIDQAARELRKQYVAGAQYELIRPAIDAMEHDFTENELSIAQLASLCGISEVYFRKLFFNVFGVTPKEYVIQKRIDYAKSLLESNSFSVTEIATLCGYAEPCHFSREFSRRVGVPPSQYGSI